MNQSYQYFEEGSLSKDGERPTVPRSSYWQHYSSLSPFSNFFQTTAEAKISHDLATLRSEINSALRKSNASNHKLSLLQKERQTLHSKSASILREIENLKALIIQAEAQYGEAFVDRRELFEAVKEEFLAEAKQAIYHHIGFYNKEIGRLEKELEDCGQQYEEIEKRKQLELKSLLDDFYSQMPDIEFSIKAVYHKELKEFQEGLENRIRLLEKENEDILKDTQWYAQQKLAVEIEVSKMESLYEETKSKRLAEADTLLQHKRQTEASPVHEDCAPIIYELEKLIGEEQRLAEEYKSKLEYLKLTEKDVSRNALEEFKSNYQLKFDIQAKQFETDKILIINKINELKHDILQFEICLESFKIGEAAHNLQSKMLNEQEALEKENFDLKEQIADLVSKNNELEKYHKDQIAHCYATKKETFKLLEDDHSMKTHRSLSKSSQLSEASSLGRQPRINKADLKAQIYETNLIMKSLLQDKQKKTSNHVILAQQVGDLEDKSCLKGAIFMQINRLAQLQYKIY